MTEQPFVSSRFLLRDKPTAYPRYDIILQDTAGPVFDLGVELEAYDGSLYLRTDHIIEMGRTIGMATAEEVANLRETILELRRQINKLPIAQEDLKIGIDNLVSSFYATINTVDPDPVGSDNTDVPVDPKPEETERKTIGSISL